MDVRNFNRTAWDRKTRNGSRWTIRRGRLEWKKGWRLGWGREVFVSPVVNSSVLRLPVCSCGRLNSWFSMISPAPWILKPNDSCRVRYFRIKASGLLPYHRSAIHQVDNVSILNDGLIADQGPLEDLLDRSQEIRPLYHSDEIMQNQLL